MQLDFDLGNTRMKWHLRASETSAYGAVAWRELEHSSEAIKELQSYLNQINTDGIEAVDVKVSSVAGPTTEALFLHWLREKISSESHFIQVEKVLAGLTVAYSDVSKLGVDRWLAMLAAQHVCEGYKIVIDAGSAITLDFLDPHGLHEGGLIVPGLPLVCEAMKGGTHNLRPETLTLTQNWQPGCDTVSGITQGASAMYAGLVKEALSVYIKKAEKAGVAIQVFLSGGDASQLLAWCQAFSDSISLIPRDYLVLDGIEIWRRHSAKSS